MWTYSQPTVCRWAPSASILQGTMTLAAPAGDPVASTVLDPSQLLDVDMDQLAWSLSLVSLSRLETQPSELAHPQPGEDSRHGRERHCQHLGDLGTGEPQPPERHDRLHPPLRGSMRDRIRGRRTVQQPELAL